MTPYLTTQGKWVFATAVVFTLVGVVAGEPLMVLFGQIPVAVLMVAVATMLPAARALDRRQVRFDIERDADDVEVLDRNANRRMAIWIENSSRSSLRIRRLDAHTVGEIELEMVEGELRLDCRKSVRFELTVRARRLGHASLQGFDVEIVDRWGLLTSRDYLPCLQVFETRPAMNVGVARPVAGNHRLRAGHHQVDHSGGAGTDLRELRDFQPGDPPRMIAWKASVRQRRLITREFDDERRGTGWVGLDISSTMRAGICRGAKFDDAIDVAAGLCAVHLEDGSEVGLLTFDHDVYGCIDPAAGMRQRRRIQRHLTGMRSVVGSSRTALEEHELERALADYLLVQQRLDFRGGHGLDGEVDTRLLRRWLKTVISEEQSRWVGGRAAVGVVDETADPVHRFFRLRGIPLDPPSEMEASAKISGLEAVLETVVGRRSMGGRLTLISDLCGVGDVERLKRPLQVVRKRRIRVDVLVPFTPAYGDDAASDGLIREVFARAERRDRLAVAEQLESFGVRVRFFGPGDEPLERRASVR